MGCELGVHKAGLPFFERWSSGGKTGGRHVRNREIHSSNGMHYRRRGLFSYIFGTLSHGSPRNLWDAKNKPIDGAKTAAL